MRAEYVIALTLVTLVVVGALAGVVMGSNWQVTVTGRVDAPPSAVLHYVGDFHSWRQWSVWNKHAFPQARFSYRGPTRGVGAEQVWRMGPTSTVWHIERLTVDALRYRRQTNEGPVRHGVLRVRPAPGGSRFTWRVSGSSGINPFDRLIAWFYSGRIRHQLQQSLTGLQHHFEAVKAGT